MSNELKNKYNLKYMRSENGKICQLFGSMTSRSKLRSMVKQDFTKEEFTVWLYDNGFKELFDLWVESNFNKMKSPSVDRLDDYKPYTFSNMRLITWCENLKKEHKNKEKSVNQVDKVTGEIIETFTGQNEASRQTDINVATICLCCQGKLKTTGGFKWEYA